MILRADARARGFSLLETLIAAAVFASAIGALAHLVVLAVKQTTGSRRALTTLFAAQSKLEDLRARAWTFTDDGTALSELAVSPPGSLAADVEGCADYLDGDGRDLGENDRPTFVRRWAISPLEPHDPDTLALHVCVFQFTTGEALSMPPESCVATIRTRHR